MPRHKITWASKWLLLHRTNMLSQIGHRYYDWVNILAVIWLNYYSGILDFKSHLMLVRAKLLHWILNLLNTLTFYFCFSGKVSGLIHTTTDTAGDHCWWPGQLWARQGVDGAWCSSRSLLWAQYTLYHYSCYWSSCYIQGN